jgi:hypothetical protein
MRQVDCRLAGMSSRRRSQRAGTAVRCWRGGWAAIALLLVCSLMPGQIRTSSYAAGSRFQAVTIIVDRDGPVVNEVAVKGPFFLCVTNRSGLRNIHLSLTRDTQGGSGPAGGVASEIAGMDHKDGSQDQAKFMELVPGVYLLTMRPSSWTVKLTVNN